MHKIILRSLSYCLIMAIATISQMIAPPISTPASATDRAVADAPLARYSQVTDVHQHNAI